MGIVQEDGFKESGKFKKFKEFLNGGKPVQLVLVEDFEEMGQGRGGETIAEKVQFVELWIDFSDNPQHGVDFIQNLSKERIEDAGLRLYESKSPWAVDELDKAFLSSMLRTNNQVRIRLKYDGAANQ